MPIPHKAWSKKAGSGQWALAPQRTPRFLSFAPPQRERFELARDFQQPRPRRRMERLERMAHRVAPDDAAFGHDRLGRAQAALAVLIVDQRQNARVGGCRLRAPAGAVMREHRLDQVRQKGAWHGAGRAGDLTSLELCTPPRSQARKSRFRFERGSRSCVSESVSSSKSRGFFRAPYSFFRRAFCCCEVLINSSA